MAAPTRYAAWNGVLWPRPVHWRSLYDSLNGLPCAHILQENDDYEGEAFLPAPIGATETWAEPEAAGYAGEAGAWRFLKQLDC